MVPVRCDFEQRHEGKRTARKLRVREDKAATTVGSRPGADPTAIVEDIEVERARLRSNARSTPGEAFDALQSPKKTRRSDVGFCQHDTVEVAWLPWTAYGLGCIKSRHPADFYAALVKLVHRAPQGPEGIAPPARDVCSE
jgi:hypothetical protein